MDLEALPIDEVDPGVGYVYRWVNLVNGKMYIGSHDGSRKNYKASGIAIKNAFEKHGIENFTREILYVGPDFREKEQEFLEKVSAASNKLYYNLKNTAIGFGSADNPNLGKFGADHPKFGKAMPEESKQKMSLARTGKGNPAYGLRGELNPRFGMKASPETRAKISAAQTGRKLGPLSEEKKAHLSKLNKGKVYPKRKCPHCPKIGGGGAMGKYHFNNCKYKENT